MKQQQFIQCGFEFTASSKLKGELNSSVLTMCRWNKGQINNDPIYDGNNTSKFYGVAWINNNFESDDCGCEVPSPKATTKEQAIKYFNQFNRFVNKTNLTIDIRKAFCGLGGCHIHMDVGYMTRDKRKLFIENVGIFLTNNPQLNWGFNDPNDNYNANSMLNRDPYSSRFRPKKQIESFLKKPLNSIPKKFALRYNEGYGSLELRIFDMPKNLKQHILHCDVAQAIYHKCLRKTNRNEVFKLKYNNKSEYKCTLKQAITKLNQSLKSLGIDTERCKEQTVNIEYRYYYNQEYMFHYCDNECDFLS